MIGWLKRLVRAWRKPTHARVQWPTRPTRPKLWTPKTFLMSDWKKLQAKDKATVTPFKRAK